MSNVLIGIIGVILFIGLALAGALFLGPRFQEATHNSKASAAVQAAKQVGDAISLYELSTGTTFVPGTAVSTLAPDYLKTVPRDPSGTNVPNVVTSSGVRIVELGLAPATSEICKSVNRTMGIDPATTGYPVENGVPWVMNIASLKGTSGCYVTGSGKDNFVVWQRI